MKYRMYNCTGVQGKEIIDEKRQKKTKNRSKFSSQGHIVFIWPNWLKFHNFFNLHWIFFQNSLKDAQ